MHLRSASPILPEAARTRAWRRMKEQAAVDGVRSSASGAAAEPFPAATVALIRRRLATREVLLLRRPPTSIFAPDAWVFPGGRLDSADYAFDHASLASGPGPEEWARLLSIPAPAEAAAYSVAALREAWEETGILLSEHEVECESLHEARRQLLSGRRRLDSLLRATGARLATDRLRYIAHWVTPDWLPRRFDTRFFLCEVDADVGCVLAGGELVDFRWLPPATAIRAAESGELSLLPPTLDTLRRLHRGEI